MKNMKISAVLMVLALVLSAAVMALSFRVVSQKPVLLSAPEDAQTVVRQMMDAVCAGDFDAVSSRLQGKPDLGVNREPEKAEGKLLWKEFLSSISYEFQGPCYASDSGIAMDLEVTYLDFNSVISSLGERAEKLLQEKVAGARNTSEIYEGENRYRQSVIDEVLAKAVHQGLEEDGKTVTSDLTIQLAFENGQWRVVPTMQLLHMFSGGTAGSAK